MRTVALKRLDGNSELALKVCGGEVVKEKVAVGAQRIAGNEKHLAELLAATARDHIAARQKTRNGDCLAEEGVVDADDVYAESTVLFLAKTRNLR